jgi:hypothetical protein
MLYSHAAEGEQEYPRDEKGECGNGYTVPGHPRILTAAAGMQFSHYGKEIIVDDFCHAPHSNRRRGNAIGDGQERPNGKIRR